MKQIISGENFKFENKSVGNLDLKYFQVKWGKVNMFQVVEDFISKFWIDMKERFKLTDLSAGPTSFSEAPAESVFSVWERIISCQPSLTLGHTVALLRVAMEGPTVSTRNSLNLSKRALDNWPSNYGERYTTNEWKPGVISKTVAKIQKQ